METEQVPTSALAAQPASINLSWTDFYTKFATRLLDYKSDRPALIEKIKAAYSSIDMRLPKVEEDNIIYDLDPFTIYGFFNKGITYANRKSIIGAFIQEFSVDSKIPDSFDGLPVLNNLSAAYFSFSKERGPSDIDHLWNLFSCAIAFADHFSEENTTAFVQAYNEVIKQRRIRWNLTMGLYWIRPDTFIALDSRNRWFFETPNFIPDKTRTSLPKFKNVPDADAYLDVINIFQQMISSPESLYKSFPEISYAAWIVSEKDNEAEKKLKPKGEGPNTLSDETAQQKRYWLYAPGKDASKWDEFLDSGIMALGWDELGDYSQYSSKSEMREKLKSENNGDSSMKNSAHATWQFCHDIKIGDTIFAKKGRNEILGRGVVTSDYIYDENRDSYRNVRKVAWGQTGSWKLDTQVSMKTLTDITPYSELIEKIEGFFEQEEEEPETLVTKSTLAPYSKEDFLADVFMDENDYDQLVNALNLKKNVILQGPPGVGKTYAAKRLAYSIMGEKDPERVTMIQFHQSYSYEDFIMGFRPSSSGFVLKKGVFYNFCKLAEEDSENPYFFIIDEINRGNLSKIFGELFMLLENDKRGIPMQLLYSDEQFTIPENVFIIGMMNTADRSLAIMDYALRRRFAFVEMAPGFESDGFKKYQENLSDASFDQLIDTLIELNKEIERDDSLGAGFQIGHSYVCRLREDTLENDLNSIVEYELIPMLKEYWFDDSQKVRTWSDKLRRSIQ